jgi:hypothetical protein
VNDLDAHQGTLAPQFPKPTKPPLETHNGLAQVGRSSFESTQVAVAKWLSKFQQLAHGTVEKIMLKQGRVLKLGTFA